MKNRRGRFVMLGVLAALAAFVPASAGASVAEAKNGCKYLKASEVKTALGLAATKGRKPPGPPDVAVCGYDLPGTTGSVNVWVQKGSLASAGFAAAKKAFSADIEAVRGLGSKAFFVSGGLNTLYVLKGKTLIYVQVVKFPDPDPATTKTQVAALTKIVLGRI